MGNATTLAESAAELMTETIRLLDAIDKHYDGRIVRINSRGSPRRCVAGVRAQLQSLLFMVHGRPPNKVQGVMGEQAHPELGAIVVE